MKIQTTRMRYRKCCVLQVKKQHGKSIPLILVAVASLIVGIVTFALFSSRADTAQEISVQSTNADNEALAALQEKLQTSLALPTDFKSVKEFSLLDVNSETITEEMFNGHWSLVFFGFTHCPDVCPITLQVMKEVVSKLERQGHIPPQVVFVSVDPVRDTAEVMKQYVAYFNEDFIGVTGDVNDVHALSSSLGIVASFTANENDPENYSVDHTASLLLIDPQRRVRAKVTPPHEADKIVADYLLMTATPN